MYWLSKTRYKVGLLLPSILLYSVFIIIPIGMAVRYSFTKYSGLGRPEFTGFSNYIRVLVVPE